MADTMTVGRPGTPDGARRRGVPGARLVTPYQSLLGEPGAPGFVTAGVLGRFPLSMLGLGAVLLVSALTGSYGLAGAVSATLAVSSSAAAPAIGVLSDRRGQRPVLLAGLTLHLLGVGGLVATVVGHAPAWAYFPPAALAGAATPQVGAFVRARWTALVGGGARLHAAFSLESALDEFVFVVGPVLATFLSSSLWPPAGVVAAAVLAGTGSLLLAGQRRTEPTPIPVPVGGGARPGSALRVPGLRVVVLSFVAVGATFGTIEVSMVAFAQEHGSTAAAGPLLAVLAFGSLLAGLWYGT
ncbi:MAG TPA: MFS transporter, partial [Mycobacteriales bacterium]|nr:MFS transporter [Mycobacteriales bacterium]